jgi:hypothetical protein
MPVAMVVILVMAFIFIALARFGSNGSLNAPGGGTNVNQSGLSTGVARQLPTLLPGASTTAVAGPYPRWRVKSVSTGARSESYIYACTTSQDAALHYLDICGRRFMPGHTVSLIVAYDSNAPRTAFTVLVSASGMFIYRWSLSSCKSGPLFVYAEDITSNPPRYSSNALVYLAAPGCANPTPRPAPWADK